MIQNDSTDRLSRSPATGYFLRCLIGTGALALGLGLVPAARAAKPTVEQVISGVQAFYGKTRDLKGGFKQVYRDTLYNRTRTSYGYIYVKKPGMMRWNYAKPEKKAFVADGKELWVWEPADKQAFRNQLDTQTLSTGLTFLLGSGDLNKEFRSVYADSEHKKLGGADRLVIKLLPVKPTAQYDYLLLVVNARDFSVGESVVVRKHSRNHFIFREIKTNTGLAASRFKFRPPPGTRVINGSTLRR